MTIQELEKKGFTVKLGTITKSAVRGITKFFVLEKSNGNEKEKFVTWSHDENNYVDPVKFNDYMKELFLQKYGAVQ